MSKLPEIVSQAWENRAGAVVLTTVDAAGKPNAIYATCVSKYDDETLVVADNYFNKTRANILAGCKAAILFITEEGKSYQVKGSLSYQNSGAIYEDMKLWNPEKHPGHAATVLNVEEVYCGGEKLIQTEQEKQ